MLLGTGVAGLKDGQQFFYLGELGLGVPERDVKPFQELQLLDDRVAVAFLGPKVRGRDLPLKLFDARPAAVDVKDTSASSRSLRGPVRASASIRSAWDFPFVKNQNTTLF
jgi:hypothetical protein